MAENPYQPPAEVNEPRAEPWRRSIVMVALTVLSVPAAAIASGGTCLGSARLMSLGSIALGIAVMSAVLVTANYWLGRSSEGKVRSNIKGAVIGFVLATAPALTCAFLLGLHAYGIDTRGGNGTPYFFVAAFTAFFLWSLGFWIGLRWQDA